MRAEEVEALVFPGATEASPQRRQEPVTRRYTPESVALDELVEVLYRLLMEAPASEPTPGESTCFPVTHK